MRKALALFVALTFAPVPFAYSGSTVGGDATPPIAFVGVVPMQGRPHSADYTFAADAAVTIQTAYEAGGGTWIRYGAPPMAVTLQAETKGIRVMFGGTPSVDNVGTVLTAGSSGRWIGVDAAAGGKICNEAAGQNAKVHMILEY